MIDDLDILLSDDFRRSVEENLERDPHRIALDRTVPYAALVASQVKNLRRAADKLPVWYTARCIIPSLAFEQSSSEGASSQKKYSGRLAIDLTCGLGVDTHALSRRFERVISVERDPFLAAVARENFHRLGAHNIEVVNSSAEEFLSTAAHSADPVSADLIYIDPDRRSTAGKKLVRIEDCSPNVVALTSQIRTLAPRMVVKLSPLFDVDEVFKIFGPGGKAHDGFGSGSESFVNVEVISLNGECKEVIADVAFVPSLRASRIRAVAIGFGEIEYSLSDDGEAAGLSVRTFTPDSYRWLIAPDVALQKARLVRRYFSEHDVWIESDNGYGFSAIRPGDIMGRTFAIEAIEPFDPKALRRRLKAGNIKNIDIMKRDFPLPAADIARQLGVREGGSRRIAFTRAAGRLWQITISLG
jgi:hypothetical protein